MLVAFSCLCICPVQFFERFQMRELWLNLRIVPCKVANFQRESMSKTSHGHQGKRDLTTQQASSPHFKTNLHKGFLQSPSPLDVGI